MMKFSALPKPALASICALLAVMFFSINDMLIKFLSGDYALHQIVLLRSTIGIIMLLAIFTPISGSFAILKTQRLGLHLLRGCCVVFANMMFFLGLAELQLAETTAIFFISPFVITIFSVIFLKEYVGAHRWTALAIGLAGVLIILRPGTDAFKLAALLPMAAAFGYAALHMLTRYIGKTESALTMSFYIQATFIVVCIVFGLFAGDGRYAGGSDGALNFLLRAWPPITRADWPIFLMLGFASAFGGYFISQAYRLSEAAYVAPFEYFALPLSILWGVIIFSEIPDLAVLFGIVMVILSGLYLVWRETVKKRAAAAMPRFRR